MPVMEAEDEAKHLTCSEVWGGFETVDRPLRMPGLDGRVYSRPYRGGAGGDVHYVSSCASGVYSRILLADVSGHGVDVARTAARLQQLMRRHIANHSQGALVRRVNEEFESMTDAGTFATAVVMTYDSRRRRLVVSNAGHPPPLYYRAQLGEWSYLSPVPELSNGSGAAEDGDGPADLPLGIEPGATYRELQYDLAPGDLVILYTDWLTEARNADTGEMLGFARLLDLARALPPSLPAEATARHLLQAVTDWTRTLPSDDDVTLLTFRANEGPRRTPIGTWVLAPFRVVRTLASSLKA